MSVNVLYSSHLQTSLEKLHLRPETDKRQTRFISISRKPQSLRFSGSVCVDALKYCCPALASETDISLLFNYFFTQNNKSRSFFLQKWRFRRNTCCVLIFNEINSLAAQRDVLTSPVTSSTRHELQSYSYLIYEGSFGCRACWHVGLVQVKSPKGRGGADINESGQKHITEFLSQH